MLRIFLNEIERTRTGAVSFHRFGAALNPHIHFHCCVIDGVFSTSAGQLRLHCARFDDEAATAVQSRVRLRVLKLLVRRGHITRAAAEDMQYWRHGGGFFSQRCGADQQGRPRWFGAPASLFDSVS